MDELHVTMIREDIAALKKETTDVLKNHEERLRSVEIHASVSRSWARAAAALATTAFGAVFAALVARATGVA